MFGAILCEPVILTPNSQLFLKSPIYIYIHTYIYIYIYIYIRIRMYVCMYVYYKLYIYIYMYVCVCVCIYIYNNNIICMHVCIYVCIYIILYILPYTAFPSENAREYPTIIHSIVIKQTILKHCISVLRTFVTRTMPP